MRKTEEGLETTDRRINNMTKFKHIKEHKLSCDCAYCNDVDPTKSIAYELEKHTSELVTWAVKSNIDNALTDEQMRKIYVIADKIDMLRRYFPTQELPSKHALRVDARMKEIEADFKKEDEKKKKKEEQLKKKKTAIKKVEKKK